MGVFQLKISLIVATLGRTDELVYLLSSVQKQTFKNFEILIIDQNPDDRLLSVIGEFNQSLNIRRLTSLPGLSRARNHGIEHVTGDVICFPDDDCWYEDVTLLGRVASFFTTNPNYSGLLGSVYDENDSLLYGKELPHAVNVSWYTCWVLSNSSAIFARRSAIREMNGFHESMGVGSGTPWASAEDIEIIARLIQAGHRVVYNPKISVRHPSEKLSGDDRIRKVSTYAMGDGFLLRQQGYPWWFVGYMLLRPLVGTGLSILKGNKAMAKLYRSRFRARWVGYFESRRLHQSSSVLDS